MYGGTMFGEPVVGTQNFHLLHAIGAADGDPLAFQQFGVGRGFEQEGIEFAVEFAVSRGQQFGGDRRHG